MDLSTIIIGFSIFLWLLMALMLIQQWAKYLKQIPLSLAWACVFLIIFTAPVLIFSDVIMGCLDLVLPEGWDEDFRK